MPVIPDTRVWAVDEILSAANMNTYLSDPIEAAAGRDGRQDLEDSLTIEDGSSGNRYIGLPKGTTGQRPTIPAGLVLLRYNTSTDEPEVGEGGSWSGFATSGVTYATLNSNGDVGTGSSQVARGNHTHPISSYGIDEVEVEEYTGSNTNLSNTTFTAFSSGSIEVTFDAGEVGIVVGIDLRDGGNASDWEFRLVRSGTQIGSTESVSLPGDFVSHPQVFVFSEDSPPDGDKTYTLQARRTSSALAFLISRDLLYVAFGVG